MLTIVSLPIPGDPSPFDSIQQKDEDGEFWTGRDLAPLMEYARWDAFAATIDKARASLALVQGEEVAASNFLHVKKVSSRGPAGSDYRLTRFAAYLTAMAGDDTKTAVAEARIYFAVQTRKAEVAELDRNTPRHEIPKSFADALQLAADQAREIEAKGKEIAELTPRAQQADHYRTADGLTAIATFASDLQVWARENHGVKLLHEEVRDFMAELGLLIRHDTIRKNEPTAEAQKRDLLRIKNTTFERSDGSSGSSRSAGLTQKGCGYVWDRAVKRIAERGSLKPSTDLDIAS